MKKQILILALVLIGITGSSFAAGTPDISKSVQISFSRQFTGASDVQWESTRNFLKVSFHMHDQILSAYYSNEGELLAVSRFITTNQLPVQLLISLKKTYSDYWVTDLFEIHVNDDTSYYVTLENASQKKILKSTDGGSWDLFRKENK